MSELRENLRRLIVLHITSSGYTVDELTDAAIALVLEEAATMAEPASDCGCQVCQVRRGLAADIRALKDKP
jgi:hypothetical protein